MVRVISIKLHLNKWPILNQLMLVLSTILCTIHHITTEVSAVLIEISDALKCSIT